MHKCIKCIICNTKFLQSISEVDKPGNWFVLSSVKSAWDDISEDIVIKFLLKTKIMNPLDESGDDTV